MHDAEHILCPGCGTTFSIHDVPGHPEIEPIGMQLDGEDPKFNLYYFNHVNPGCKSTFAVQVDFFLPLITEPVSKLVLAGSRECNHYCVRIDELRACGNECRYAPFRRFLLELLKQYAETQKAPSA